MRDNYPNNIFFILHSVFGKLKQLGTGRLTTRNAVREPASTNFNLSHNEAIKANSNQKPIKYLCTFTHRTGMRK